MRSPTPAPTEDLTGGPLLIFDTHPIQYRSPVFKALHERGCPFKVFFFNQRFDGNKWWFHEVGKIPPQKWGLALQEGFPCEVLDTGNLGIRKSLARMKSILSSESPSAVLLYGYYLPEHWMLRWLCARMGIALLFVGETFSEGSTGMRRLLKTPLQRYFYQGISQFIAIGEKTSRYYRERGIAPSRIVSAKYCTDIAFFSLSAAQGEAAREQWRRSLAIPADAFVLLFVGRLFERKRPEDLIALHHRLKRHQRLYTVLVGNGPQEERLRSEARGEDRILFAGFRDQEQTRQSYYGSDLLIVPSTYETWGLVVNEAFACGRPALVTENCGTAGDLVIPGETGYVFPVGDLEVAARQVERCLEDAGALSRMGRESRRRVRAGYHVDQFADAISIAWRRTR